MNPERSHAPFHTPFHAPFHTAVIGAGSGGLTVAIGLARFGKRVALVERKYVGGDCTNVGCVPSKTLIHFAKGGDLDAGEVLARVQEKRNALREEETEWVKDIDNLTFFAGTARLTGEGRLELSLENGDAEISAKNIVIATGSSPVRIDVPGLSEGAHADERKFVRASQPAQTHRDGRRGHHLVGDGLCVLQFGQPRDGD